MGIIRDGSTEDRLLCAHRRAPEQNSGKREGVTRPEGEEGDADGKERHGEEGDKPEPVVCPPDRESRYGIDAHGDGVEERDLCF
jgi:hypothetical protein